jgi:hypothetical protein
MYSSVLLDKLVRTRVFRKCPAFYWNRKFLLYSQQPVTESYPEPDNSIAILKMKAVCPLKRWNSPTRLQGFTTTDQAYAVSPFLCYPHI